jgi:hypothetical protein
MLYIYCYAAIGSRICYMNRSKAGNCGYTSVRQKKDSVTLI